MGSAGALGCPKCGATVDPEAARCPYCEARLATVACPACFGKFFRGFSNCPWCGEEAEREPIGPTERGCPKCLGQPKLTEVRIGQTLVEECGRCAGIWLDHASFERLQKERDEHVAILGLPVPATLGKDLVRYYPCPTCGEVMNRLNFARCSGVILDACKQHGTWFDADELRRIVAFIETGGLAKSRDRELARLKDEQQALESKMRDLQYERQRDAAPYVRAHGAGFDIDGGVFGILGSLLHHFFSG